MLDFDFEDIDGMDADAGDDEEPAPIGPWKATSSYDIYMVDTPKEGDGNGTTEDDPPRNSLSASVSGAAQNPTKANTAIPAREIIILRRVPKKTPSSKAQPWFYHLPHLALFPWVSGARGSSLFTPPPRASDPPSVGLN